VWSNKYKGAIILLLIVAAGFGFSFHSARAAGTFQILNFPASTTVTVNQPYSFYVSFLYSGNNIPGISFVGNPLPDNFNVGVITYAGNGLDNVQITGESKNLGVYPLTLELTDNYGAFLTQPFAFTVSPVVPTNAHLTSPTTWSCNDGYVNTYGYCQPPQNGTISNGVLTCGTGYINVNSTCQPESEIANTLCYSYTQYSKGDGSSAGSYTASGTLVCNCPPNETWNSAINKCNATSVVTPTVTATIETSATPIGPTAPISPLATTTSAAKSLPSAIIVKSKSLPASQPSTTIAVVSPDGSSSSVVAANATSSNTGSNTGTPSEATSSNSAHTGFFTTVGSFLGNLFSKLFSYF
jgi:hypothetical protein